MNTKRLRNIGFSIVATISLLTWAVPKAISVYQNFSNGINQEINQFEQSKTNNAPSSESTTSSDAQALNFTGERILELGPLDSLGRSTWGHIQLNSSQRPKETREALTFDPVGWHNYKLRINKNGPKAWLMNRGHLIGYQFSGLNNEAKNLTIETAYLNQGSLKGMDDSNIHNMLYYENNLATWLTNHPNYFLDYKVTPIYSGNELVPRKIRLEYIGLDNTGKTLRIQFGTSYETISPTGYTSVILDNVSPNATINYLDGTATPEYK
jgi:DNA-entry nuclease